MNSPWSTVHRRRYRRIGHPNSRTVCSSHCRTSGNSIHSDSKSVLTHICNLLDTFRSSLDSGRRFHHRRDQPKHTGDSGKWNSICMCHMKNHNHHHRTLSHRSLEYSPHTPCPRNKLGLPYNICPHTIHQDSHNSNCHCCKWHSLGNLDRSPRNHRGLRTICQRNPADNLRPDKCHLLRRSVPVDSSYHHTRKSDSRIATWSCCRWSFRDNWCTCFHSHLDLHTIYQRNQDYK